jgi:hypothetical protein
MFLQLPERTCQPNALNTYELCLAGLYMQSASAQLAAVPNPCLEVPVSFYPVSGTTDLGALNSPAPWTTAAQKLVGNENPQIVEKAVISLAGGVAPTLHFSFSHFMLQPGATVPAACQFGGVLPVIPPIATPPIKPGPGKQSPTC